MKRKSVSLAKKLASALLALGHIPYEESKALTAKQIISRYQFDHWPILHSHGGPDEPWNLRPLLVAQHREKSKGDASIAAKVKRLLGETCTGPKRPIPQRANPWPPKGSRKILSRSQLTRS